jgi:hypothetical protein
MPYRAPRVYPPRRAQLRHGLVQFLTQQFAYDARKAATLRKYSPRYRGKKHLREDYGKKPVLHVGLKTARAHVRRPKIVTAPENLSVKQTREFAR